MNEDKLDYLIGLNHAILNMESEIKDICIQNNMILNAILEKCDSPEQDVKSIVLDVIGNLAAYRMVGGNTES